MAGDEELGLSGFETVCGSERVALRAPELKFTMPIPDAINGIAATEKLTSLKSLMRNVKSEAEKNAIADAFEKTGWNRKAARLLRLSYRAILYKIDEYHMSASQSYVSSLAGTRFSGLAPARGNGKTS